MSSNEQNQDRIGMIVAAFAARSDVGPDDIVDLYARLATAGNVQAAVPAPVVATMQPALPIENAVTDDKVFCLCCGRGFKMLKRHLGSEHGMTETEYRMAFGLGEDVPLVAPNYSREKASHAKQAGFGKYDRSVLADET